ncbi:IclR family transcriptional regulator C-terminal domain-containing protein [Streptomyces sp. NPDC014991]|uniref:IclR family transcriptional regulator domain-containing protein n=1 Tax=Streptomyces sp. NPDC014991 TaxID=3364935 RepID=UPI0036F50400
MELGNACLAALRLPALLGAHADALADELDESVSLAVADPDRIRLLHQATRRRAMSLNHRGRTPAGRRDLLADTGEPTSSALTEVRTRGCALVGEEPESGLRSIAVPVRDRTGRAVATLNVATHTARPTLDDCVQDLLPALRPTADRIQTDLHTAPRFAHVPSS